MPITLQMNLKRRNIRKEKQAKKVNLRRQKGTYWKNDLKNGYVPQRQIRREEMKQQKKIEKKLIKKDKKNNQMEFE